jgi:CHAT domain-containing protein
VSGGFEFYGPVIVRGKLEVVGQSGSKLNGAVMAANVDLDQSTVLGDATVRYSNCVITRAKQAAAAPRRMVQRALSPDNPRIFDSMINLAETLVGLGNIDKAEELHLRIFESREKNFGQNHPLTAHALFNLGNLYALKKDFEKSESFYIRSLKIREEFFGTDNPVVAEVLSGLSLLLARKGNITQAVELQKRADEIDERNISINLAIGSERQKTAFLESLFDRTNQSVLIQTQFAPENQTALEFAAVSVLRQKGRVMDAVSNNLSAIRQHFGSEDRLLLDALNKVNTRLSELIVDRPEDETLAAYQNKIKNLSDEREKLEDEISRHAAGLYIKSAAVNLSNIQALIPPDSALVEFAVYDSSSFDNSENKKSELRYVAYILQNQGKIKWADIGRVEEIDKSVDLFRQALRDPKRADFREIARELDNKLMLPVRRLTGDKKHLLISPDGNLNLIPFEALLDENGKYLIENYAVGYLTSGRDLLRLQTRRESGNKTLVVANPNFGEPDAGTVAGLRKPKTIRNAKRQSITATRNLSDTFFAPLGGTAQEARAIQMIFPGAEVLTEARATESALKQTTAPQILHIATHGFFLEDKDVFKDANTKAENPLLRSGLAFAGANSREKDGKDDGILTALEASGLNLWGTKLVVLSACDTGLGEVKNGEGVYGLRRAFVLAGTESLVMSLWSVSDLVTRELMTSYYKNLKAGMGRGSALRQVQLEMLKKPNRQHPFYWASFIQSGEWANLDGKR